MSTDFRNDRSVKNGELEGEGEDIIADIVDGRLADTLHPELEITARGPGRSNRPGEGTCSAGS